MPWGSFPGLSTNHDSVSTWSVSEPFPLGLGSFRSTGGTAWGPSRLFLLLLLFFFLAALGLGCGAQASLVTAHGSQFPSQGLNSHPLHWKAVLTTRPPGKAKTQTKLLTHIYFFYSKLFALRYLWKTPLLFLPSVTVNIFLCLNSPLILSRAAHSSWLEYLFTYTPTSHWVFPYFLPNKISQLILCFPCSPTALKFFREP